ncbi:MAG TPA: hypothetical protein VG734_08535 [Lacunisphaera sp.]|nr:hypothetical protein [Lacunisphaera sp.]
MRSLFALTILAVFNGCALTPIPKIDEKAEREKLMAEIAAIEAQDAPRREKEAKAKAEHEKWLADRRGARYLELHPETLPITREHILKSELAVGMSPDEAWAAIGPILPASESDGVGGKMSIWKTTEGTSCFLYFVNQKLVRWTSYGN